MAETASQPGPAKTGKKTSGKKSAPEVLEAPNPAQILKAAAAAKKAKAAAAAAAAQADAAAAASQEDAPAAKKTKKPRQKKTAEELDQEHVPSHESQDDEEMPDAREERPPTVTAADVAFGFLSARRRHKRKPRKPRDGTTAEDHKRFVSQATRTRNAIKKARRHTALVMRRLTFQGFIKDVFNLVAKEEAEAAAAASRRGEVEGAFDDMGKMPISRDIYFAFQTYLEMELARYFHDIAIAQRGFGFHMTKERHLNAVKAIRHDLPEKGFAYDDRRHYEDKLARYNAFVRQQQGEAASS